MFDVQDLKLASQMKCGIEGINLAVGSTNKGDAPSSGIFISDGRIFTGKYSSPKFDALSYEEKRKLGETRDGETGHNAKSNQKVVNIKRQRTDNAKTFNKKLKALQIKFASLEAGKAASEEGVPGKYTATDSPPVGDRHQMGG